MFKFIFLMLFSMAVSANIANNSCVALLYHHFSDDTPKSTSVSPALFEQHLQYLQANDFKVLSLKTMFERLDTGNLPDKCVVLTADDAYHSIAQNAYPLLKQYQMPMTVFVATDGVDKNYKALMSWQQMRDIQGKTIQFYNHSSSHAHLLDLDKVQIQSEIENAQMQLNKELNVSDKIFAYPYGEARLSTRSALKDWGYQAFGQHSGVVSNHSDRQDLPRFPMAAHYAKMPSFKTKINTLPMPIVPRKIDSIFTQNPPTLKLEFTQKLSKHQRKNLNCFASGGTNITWRDDKNVEVIAKKPLMQRRNKYNCTMPSKQNGRYYWHSIQWVNPNISE